MGRTVRDRLIEIQLKGATTMKRSLNAMRLSVPTLTLSALLLVGACAPVSQEAKKDLAKPVDCSNATQEIATLESEKASVLKRVEMGARYVVPVAAVTDILRSYHMGDESSVEFYEDKESVLTGDYNAAIDRKIAHIKEVCGV
jgi:hypothetical protein